MMLKDLSLGYLATSKRENEIVICIKNYTFTTIEDKRTNNLSEGEMVLLFYFPVCHWMVTNVFYNLSIIKQQLRAVFFCNKSINKRSFTICQV